VINSKFVSKLRTDYYPTKEQNKMSMDCKSAPKMKINFRTCREKVEGHNIIKKLRGLSPRANYTDRAAAAGRRS